MFKRTEKKLIALLLAIAMLVTLLPYYASAKETAEAAPALAPEITPEPLEPDCRILNYVDEAVFLAGNHVARLPAEESLSSYVFLNADGTRTVYYMDEAVKYVDRAGNILEKDVTLAAAQNGYATTQNDLTLSLPADPATGIRMNWNGHTVSIRPQGGSLAQPQTLEGNSVKYPDYFGQGIDLVYTPTLSGLKEDIILASYTGVNTFTFMLNTGGLNLYQANGRYYLAASKAAAERINLGDLVSFDATGRFSLGTVTTQTVMAGNIYRLTLTVDEAFLTDPNTVYPVSIDPTLTVSDNTHGAGAIEDVSIYSGTPNMNAGTWTYNHCGYYDSTYKVARTLFRLTGLTSDVNYQSITASNITSAEFHIREATGSAGLPVYLYANTGSSTWTESGATWNNSGLTLGDKYATASPASNTDTVYDITELVKDWKNGSQTAAKGFVMVSSNEISKDKAFYASEYSTTSYRPYVVVEYNLSDTIVNLLEGGTSTLSSAGITGTITWASSNTSVATVSSSGVVTAKAAGTATVTASVSGTVQKTFYIYVIIADGVYYIKNVNSSYYLGVENSGISSGSDAQQVAKKTSDPNRLSQLWKVKYISGGYYSLRPMHNLSTALRADGTVVEINDVGASDSSLGSAYLWTITAYSSGKYYFKTGSSGTKAMAPSGYSTSANTDVIMATYSSSLASFRWSLTSATVSNQVRLYDTRTKSFPTSVVRYVAPGESLTVPELSVYANYTSASTNTQNIRWYSSDSSKVSVNATTGTITGVTPGSTTTIYAMQSGTSYTTISYTTYTIHVTEIPEGSCFIYSEACGEYMQVTEDDSGNNYLTAGLDLATYDFVGAVYQRWTFTHLGDGYYKIISDNSTFALSIPSSSANIDGINLTQNLYSGAETQQWKVSKSASGNYILRPKSAEAYSTDFCMSREGGSSYNFVAQSAYSNDTDYSDEWIVIPQNDLSLIALPETYDRTSFFDSVISDLSSIGYTNYFENADTINSGMTDSEVLGRFANSKISVIRTHGLQAEIETTGGSLTRSEILALPAGTLNYAELIVFGACDTGIGEAGAADLVNAAYARGCTTVIGFTVSVHAYEANWWCEKFFELLASGVAVESACIQAIDYAVAQMTANGYTPTLKGIDEYAVPVYYYYIAGDKTATFD